MKNILLNFFIKLLYIFKGLLDKYLENKEDRKIKQLKESMNESKEKLEHDTNDFLSEYNKYKGRNKDV